MFNQLTCKSRTWNTWWATAVGFVFFLASNIALADPPKQVTYYYTDPQGNVLAEADTSGNITARYDYTPHGVQIMDTASDAPRFTGHVSDSETAMVYMQQRYYDPSIGRFLSTDPSGPSAGNLNHFGRYGYAYDNPYRFTDPDGRCPVCVLVLAGVSLFTVSDYANAPGIEDKPISMSPAEKLEAVAGALPASRGISTIRSVVRTTERLTQRSATREAKRQVGIPTSQQASSQSNGSVDGTKVGRQQTFEAPKEGGGTETKAVQVARDIRGEHAGMPQVEAGTVKDGGQTDAAGRLRIQNETKVRVDYDPNL